MIAVKMGRMALAIADGDGWSVVRGSRAKKDSRPTGGRR
jgi:hypothetical protein